VQKSSGFLSEDIHESRGHMVEAILPGTYVTVRDEGLISVGGVASGNIGIVGTAARGDVDTVKLIGSFEEAKEIFGDSNAWQGGQANELTLIRSLELIYNNGGRTVYAVRVAAKKTLKKAIFSVKTGDVEWCKLEAKTPGTWGNSIQIKILTEEATNLKRLELICNNVREAYSLQNDFSSAISGSKLVNVISPTKGLLATMPENLEGSFQEGNDGAEAAGEEYKSGLALLENEAVNIALLAGQTQPWAAEALVGHLRKTAEIKHERMGLVGGAFVQGKDDLDTIANHQLNSDRLIYVAPGIQVSSRTAIDQLPGAYTAAAVAGLIASFPVQASPTNKVLTIGGLTSVFNASQLETLVEKRVLAIERRDGFRIVKGITTNDGAWRQITTRRIVDYAIYGVRSGCDPYIGKLNNERVRGAMKATLDAFLTRMVNDEALVRYTLSVTATRDQEKAGETMVALTLQPTFSIDYIKVTMYLS
jgi:hypothetical protein